MRHRLSALVVLVALGLAVACTGDDDDGGSGPKVDREQVESDVTKAHEAADKARRDSAAAPAANPDLPALAKTHTGGALVEWVQTTTRLQSLGLALRYPEGSQRAVTIEGVKLADDGERATLDVCAVSDGEVYLVSSGQVVSSGIRTTRTTETMTRAGDSWRLAERKVEGIEDGAHCEGADSTSTTTAPD